ncbi:peptidoglycan/xylan/chitin deacetylase (PgdA/CDA1 family) [Rhizomicrobium palustre]|uniref:Chitooligosaccharide deacetylase n=1 Tax=Rhizomicrobium palustre TaxID=189966 RepID=A0A846MXK4_9PROT|nr:polysaccharide deacetylase family protein [Rhizomicrobium palustre]NIK88308.1 peptidoglycan/xylan/chitin deacetylase (PgdA/CDA1 family) [Rhizomicrobium palustre]
MAEPRVVLTFDDLPVHGVLPAGFTRMGIAKELTDALTAGGIPPTVGFVNGVGAVNEPASAPVLKLWVESGNFLGNHTWSHPGLSNTPTASFETNTNRNEETLRQYAGTSDWHWFRYPFVDEGKDEAQRAEFRAFLAKSGYKIGTVTTGLNDWDYPSVYARCLAKSDGAAIAKLEAMYLARAEEGLAYSRKLSAALYGHDIPYIMLLHIGSFQAHMLPKVIARYKELGVSFISLQEAMTDPHYAAYADPSLPAPPRGLEQALAAKNIPVPQGPDNHMAELEAMCK